MARAVRFYQALGFLMAYGGETADFTSFRVGAGHLNLAVAQPSASDVTRVIFYVDDVDAMYAHVLAQGFSPEAPPRDASCNERYFPLTYTDGLDVAFIRAPSDS